MSVYNGEEYLNEAIDSVLNQTFKDFELIVIDDCSKDKTAERKVLLYISHHALPHIGIEREIQLHNIK